MSLSAVCCVRLVLKILRLVVTTNFFTFFNSLLSLINFSKKQRLKVRTILQVSNCQFYYGVNFAIAGLKVSFAATESLDLILKVGLFECG